MSFLAPAWETLKAKRPEFEQAEQVWNDVLAPELGRREEARKSTIKAAIKRTVLAFAGTLLAAIIVNILLGGFFIVALFIGIAGAAVASALKWIPVFSMKTQTKELVLGSAAQSFGFTYETLHPDLTGITDLNSLKSFSKDWMAKQAEKSKKASLRVGGMKVWSSDDGDLAGMTPPSPAFKTLREARLLPSYDNCKFEDLIKGTRAGADFSLVECKLSEEQGSGNSRSTVTKFQGLLLNIDYPEPFYGRTMLARSRWWKRGRESSDLKKVQLVSIELDKAFTVYSTDQVEARTLLTPDRMERLIRLERHFHGGKLRGIFEDGHMTLALEADDQFEAGSIFKPLVDPARYVTALEEMGMICDLIDGFLTREWRGDPKS
ncbi:MAG: DUF3137 domain-containing protein [Hyphomonadaceae bacterium]